MQVNLHGTPRIPGVFFYCFGHTEKQNLAQMNSRKYAITVPPQPLPTVERGHPLPTPYHPTTLGAFGASIRLAPSALGTTLFSTPNRN